VSHGKDTGVSKSDFSITQGDNEMKPGIIALIFLLLIAMMQCGVAQTAPNSVGPVPASKDGSAGQVYSLPFASSGNTIELTVSNTGTANMTSVKVLATEVPSWIKFSITEQNIAILKSGQETAATFTFAVDKSAPVQEKQVLRFVISGSTGETWTKEITVAVAPPDKFEVYQNFPNPFNPTTAISYQLSAVSRVNLKIYNLLGQEVASLVDGDRLPGYHQELWDATRCASGVYIYQLIATDDKGQKQVARKRMMMLK
jgi:hypothetical protein